MIDQYGFGVCSISEAFGAAFAIWKTPLIPSLCRAETSLHLLHIPHRCILCLGLSRTVKCGASIMAKADLPPS
jgi:hypothetical protein